MTRLLAGPSRRYSYPILGVRVTFCPEPTASGSKGVLSNVVWAESDIIRFVGRLNRLSIIIRTDSTDIKLPLAEKRYVPGLSDSSHPQTGGLSPCRCCNILASTRRRTARTVPSGTHATAGRSGHRLSEPSRPTANPRRSTGGSVSVSQRWSPAARSPGVEHRSTGDRQHGVGETVTERTPEQPLRTAVRQQPRRETSAAARRSRNGIRGSTPIRSARLRRVAVRALSL